MKTRNNKFLALVENAMSQPGRLHMRPVIEKELLHYDILFALNSARLLDKLIFQGGTALRLCYGAPRFSEDLDFVGGKDFKTEDLIAIKSCLEDYLSKHYGLEVSVKEPKELLEEPEYRNVKVSKWQIRIVTHPEKRDIPKQVIKIEVANIPAYTKEPKQLLHNYDFLPDGYGDTIVIVETLDEILSDKVISFVNCQDQDSPNHLRYRDIWDLYWLKQRGAAANMGLIKKKIYDYKINDYTQKIDTMIERLPNIIQGGKFKEQMARFLPMDVQERTLLNENYLYLLLEEIDAILKTIGFEWEEKGKDIYCTNFLRDLTPINFETVSIQMLRCKDKSGLVATARKKSCELIVSSANEPMAKELSMNPIYRVSLPKGYKVDASLQPGQWYIKFSEGII